MSYCHAVDCFSAPADGRSYCPTHLPLGTISAPMPTRHGNGVYANGVVVDGTAFPRCTRAVGIARCTAPVRNGGDDCGKH